MFWTLELKTLNAEGLRLKVHAVTRTLIILLIAVGGCDHEQPPISESDTSRSEACTDLDLDGVIHPCLECLAPPVGGCIDSTAFVQKVNQNEPQILLYQSLRFPSESVEVGGRTCIFNRTWGINGGTNALPFSLRQSDQTLERFPKTEPPNDATRPPVQFDTEANLAINFTDLSGRKSIAVQPPAQFSTNVDDKLSECVDSFATPSSNRSIEFDMSGTYLFIGGSQQLPSAADEEMFSFFVIDGELSNNAISMPNLVREARQMGNSVRCAVSNWNAADWYENGHWVTLQAQVTAQRQVEFVRELVPMGAPAPFFDTSANSVSVKAASVPGWGSPLATSITRSGIIDGNQYTESIVCEIEQPEETVSFDIDLLLGDWQDTEVPNTVVRLRWTKHDTPLRNHPLIQRRLSLSVQRSF